ncbi:carbon-monoxide dehydrogenase small subunit/2-furoyl-CoA dehydrogenase 2Fe-2S iron sulfur subunit [Monaibacterium marinum]|uniref:Carbon-monoxide dehydrogenase small subunit/2-furoyl-CoA dehydrogenase 2Fe-2S iron sulfur subunit n=1 Tax=Pontivivens marinum TaxID=1690039 RepID=A0A2C9CUM5_9RHOB|nr:(2Fe-2S)-binding protein [Monaibacterium marinum]SOH94957.1 carbon-monoxide dehydrogenase small subunit/2-furoyl-CoA dehydrogenase 2Fe-2S iron sulfur subunit [Monaibacterium marinum]
MSDLQAIRLNVNGVTRAVSVEPSASLADVLRQELRLTALHLGCEHGVCGACNVLLNGRAVRACLTLAVQAEEAEVKTLEGLSAEQIAVTLKECFRKFRALQCGFCTPGILVLAVDLIAANPDPSEEEVRDWLSGNLCRCTGYQPIVGAIIEAAKRLRGAV